MLEHVPSILWISQRHRFCSLGTIFASTPRDDIFLAWQVEFELYERLEFVPVFEREARIKFFVTFESWCSSNFLVLQMRDTREFEVFQMIFS
jgi:hypothetical protein